MGVEGRRSFGSVRADGPDWKQADPQAIERALQHALSKPSGGWFVVGDSRSLLRRSRRAPVRLLVDDVALVAWAASAARLTIGPAACPHLGADLAEGRVSNGCLVCPWHGLAIGPNATDAPARSWLPLPVHDDGVLTWVQLEPTSPDATPAPLLGPRPSNSIAAVLRSDATCEPRDIVANRLDPWHGVHLHPYAFAHLEVIDATDDAIDLAVGYRVTPRHVIDVRARFSCPDPRTIVMEITDGEGAGSVVETHATPQRRSAYNTAARTAMIEATLATSDRPGFRHAQRGAVIARPIIRALAARLWRDDIRYAERTYQLRSMRSSSTENR